MQLQVLIVEDTSGDLAQYLRDLPAVFQEAGVEAKLHGCGDFDEAFQLVADPLRRFDLIVSDTYRGNPRAGDARVIEMVRRYRTEGRRFCPLVVYSSSAKPDGLEESDFVKWADKAAVQGIETAIQFVLQTGVPQIARKLHDELDQAAGSFLWEFLEKNWQRLTNGGKMKPQILERVIRRRAATQIGDMVFRDDKWVPILDRAASEYYIYPRLERNYYSLGDVLQHRERKDDFRVVLLHALGYRYRLHVRSLPGTPDIVLPSRRKIIEVQGCFWHRHNCRFGRVTPKTRRQFWEQKFKKNRQRDRNNRRALRRLGWDVLVIWECQTRTPDHMLQRLVSFLES